MKLNSIKTYLLAAIALTTMSQSGEACTGITLKSKQGETVVARTIEWGGTNLHSQYVVVPRKHQAQSLTPTGQDGLKFTAQYGYIGLAVEMKEFIAEGINEAGLSAGLFYFPQYGQYETYHPELKAQSLADLQLVPYILGKCATLEEVKSAVEDIHIINIDPRASTVHWRFADQQGRQLVLEIIDGKTCFYENKLGVLTNSPGFEWQLTNLNNYVNLFPGTAAAQNLGNLSLRSFGAGSGFLGLPGDVTPPSRFVRAAFYQATAPQQNTALATVLQSFQILNNFDIPIGIEFPMHEVPVDIPSATQWTSATDLTNIIIYFRTMYNSMIRSIDLKTINFAKVHYQAIPLDEQQQTPVTTISIQ